MSPDPRPSSPVRRVEDEAATFCATLVDEWARAGVTDAVVCPGSRSTPMALALAADPRIALGVHHDERAGAFTALGLGLASGRPAVVLTTSGTAAAELHPAVVEAHQSSVPLIAVTADRPPEMADAGAPQTIDQVHLFGRSVRWYHAPGVPDEVASGSWRSLGARSVAEARGAGSVRRPGPVHLDLAFREPLVGRAGPLPPGRPDGAPWTVAMVDQPVPPLSDVAAAVRDAERGLVIAGAEPGSGAGGTAATAEAALRVASALGWPLVVDARLRGALGGSHRQGVTVVGAADAVLRHPATAAALAPDVILHLGAPVASRVVAEWLASHGATEIRVTAHGWIDPAHGAAHRVVAPAAALVEAVGTDLFVGGRLTEAAWTRRWDEVEGIAQRVIDDVLAGHDEVTEPGVARTVLATLEPGEALVVSSSMPVRDLEWYGRPRTGVEVHANRGANGIDGVVSTAVGVARATAAPTVCLVGDVALLHDANALIGLTRRGVDLTIVVVDNDGGGIFSFLPQATDPGGEAFEVLYGTPHGVDLRALASAHGIDTVEPATAAEVGPALRASLAAGGVRLVRVSTERAANVEVHREIHDAVAAALI